MGAGAVVKERETTINIDKPETQVLLALGERC